MNAQIESQAEIAAGATVRGRVTGKDPLRVLGRIEGEIALEAALFVERGAVIKAQVRAERVTVAGIIIGDVEATELVEVTPEGRVAGDISAPALRLAEGGRIAGALRVGDMEARVFSREPAKQVQPEPEILFGAAPEADLVRSTGPEAKPAGRRRIAVKRRMSSRADPETQR